jgi:hypothetical protein
MVKKGIFPVLMAALVLGGCASGAKNKDADTPPWLNDLPPEGYVWGIGIAKQSSDQFSMTTAEARARTSIARQLETTVQAMFVDYSRDSGTVDSQSALSLQEDVQRQITNMKLTNAQPKERWKAPDGTWWVLIEYNKADAKNEVAAIIDNEAARFAEFKKDEALRMLDDQLKKNERPLQVRD